MRGRFYLGATALCASLLIGSIVAFAFESSKLTPGIVVEGTAFQSTKLSSGIVVEGAGFNASKLSVGIVLEDKSNGGGVFQRAPLTHW